MYKTVKIKVFCISCAIYLLFNVLSELTYGILETQVVEERRKVNAAEIGMGESLCRDTTN